MLVLTLFLWIYFYTLVSFGPSHLIGWVTFQEWWDTVQYKSTKNFFLLFGSLLSVGAVATIDSLYDISHRKHLLSWFIQTDSFKNPFMGLHL